MKRFLRHFLGFTLVLTLILSTIPSHRVYTRNLSSNNNYISSSNSSPWYYSVNISTDLIYVAVNDVNAVDTSRVLISIGKNKSEVSYFINNVSSTTLPVSSIKDGIRTVTIYEGQGNTFTSKAYFLIKKENNHVSLYSPYNLSNRNWLENYNANPDFDTITFLSNEAFEPIIEKAFELTRDCNNRYEKIQVIHDYICRSIAYDYEAVDQEQINEASDPLWVFKNRRGVCSGISHLAQIMLLSVGIYNELTEGYSIIDPSSSNLSSYNNPFINHEWNLIYIEGHWTSIDFTWDCNNKYYGAGNINNLTNQAPSYNNYLVTNEFFSMNHIYIEKCDL